MITFQKIRWKNFLSTGNQFTEVNFQNNNTNLIIGTNGTGKSTVLDALTFSLFNKPFRKINKGQLANSVNEKDCLVEVDFEINLKQYRVRRGIKPNLFEIVVDGTPMHKEADDRVMQKMLEENILKVNYKSFTQIVILGSTNFVPFMQLSGSNRRDVIEDLLDIRIFSAMNSLIKDKIKGQKDEIKTLDLSKDNIKDKVEMQTNFINELESQGKQRIDEKKEKIEQEKQKDLGDSVGDTKTTKMLLTETLLREFENRMQNRRDLNFMRQSLPLVDTYAETAIQRALMADKASPTKISQQRLRAQTGEAALMQAIANQASAGAQIGGLGTGRRYGR